MWIYVLTPIVGTSFPALAPLVLATAGALGYKVMVDMKETGQINRELRRRLEEETIVSLKVDELVFDSMQEEVKREESLFFVKDEITLGVMKDERNQLRISVSAPKGFDQKILERRGREFAGELAQAFALNRAVEELQRMNAEVAEEEQLENGDIRLKISRWT